MADENETGGGYVTIPTDGSGSPAHLPGSVVPRQGGLAPVLPDVSSLSAADCRAQYRELMEPGKVAAMNGYERKTAIAKGDALMKRAHELDAGTAKVTPAHKPQGGSDTARAGQEQPAAANTPEAAAAAALASQGLEEMDFGPAGNHPQAYENVFTALRGSALGSELSAVMHENAVPIQLAQTLHGAAAPAFLKASDEGKADMIDRAFDAVAKTPGGEQITEAAEYFVSQLPPGKWRQACLIAASHPAGVRWLAQKQMQAAR